MPSKKLNEETIILIVGIKFTNLETTERSTRPADPWYQSNHFSTKEYIKLRTTLKGL